MIYIEKCFFSIQDRVLLTQKITILLICASSPYICLFYYFGYIDIAAKLFVIEILFGLCWFAGSRYRTTISRLGIILIANIATFYFSQKIGWEAGIQMLHFSMMLIPLAVFSPDEKKLRLASVGMAMCLFFLGSFFSIFENQALFPQFQVNIIRNSVALVNFLIALLSMNFVLKQLRLFNKSVQDSKSALQTAYTTLHAQQTLLKRRITAIHDMTTSCGDLAEWEKICVNIFQYELNIHPMIWLSQTAEKSLSKELPNLLFIKDNNAMTLLSEVGCLSWRQAGVAVLLPIVFGDAVQAVIGLSPEEPLSNEDMDFTVMVSKDLQKSLQFIRAAETLKTLNMATFVEANESLFREFRITDRELEIIGLLVQGTSNAGISSALVISASTTKRHIYNIFQKLGIKSRFELLGWVGDRAVEG